jgi:APA family basic amino acid/polyamine antiporter
VARVANFTLYITFAVINAAVILLRYRMPDRHRPFRVPLSIGPLPVLPVLGILTCVLFLFQLDAKVLLIGGGILLAAFLAGAFLQKTRISGTRAE